jgi:DNA polymerase-4
MATQPTQSCIIIILLITHVVKRYQKICMEKFKRTILHVDMNNFFASVECQLNPDIRPYPVAVCGDVEERHGIVLAKNYKAKAFGVKTGEAVWQAKSKCKDLLIIPPHYDEYMKYSKRAREIYSSFTDLVEPFGMDECWLDVSGGKYIKVDGEKIANEIREKIKFELGLTVSVGVSFNKIFAKLGSDIKKPDAVTVISEDTFKEQIWDLPVSDLLGVGYATSKKLCGMCVHTIGDLARYPLEFLEYKFGKCGIQLWQFANGLDHSRVTVRDFEALDKSCGHGTTALQDIENPAEVWKFMLELSQEIGHRLRTYNKKAAGVAIAIRDNDLFTKQWQCGIPLPTQSPSIIAKVAFSLFQRSYDWHKPIRSITVRAINLISPDTPSQLDMFYDADRAAKAEALDKTIDDLRQRFGNVIIRNACLMDNPKMPGFKHKTIMPNGVPV